MKRALYAWEMGAGLGHIAAFLPVAEALRTQGCEIVCSVRDCGTAAQVLTRRRIPWLQAPFVVETTGAGSLQTYTDILLRHDFADPNRLLGHVGAWLSLFELYRPQVVIADHSPVALLAARLAGLPTMLFGTGFCCPPAGTPMPLLRPWENPDTAARTRSEEIASASLQRVAESIGRRGPDTVAELLSVDETTVLGFPEIDHYPSRPRSSAVARYWGVIGDAGLGESPDWPAVAGRRLFVYVRPACPHLDALFAALGELGQPTILYCPGITAAQRNALHAHSHLRVATAPLDLSRVFAEADAAITNGSFSSSTGFLLAGKPVLVLPTQLEQFLYGRQLEQHGLGLLCASEQVPADLIGRIYRLATDPALRANVAEFAVRYAGFDQSQVVSNIARRVIALGRTAQ